MDKKRIAIEDLNENAAASLSEDDLCKVTGGIIAVRTRDLSYKVKTLGSTDILSATSQKVIKF